MWCAARWSYMLSYICHVVIFGHTWSYICHICSHIFCHTWSYMSYIKSYIWSYVVIYVIYVVIYLVICGHICHLCGHIFGHTWSGPVCHMSCGQLVIYGVRWQLTALEKIMYHVPGVNVFSGYMHISTQKIRTSLDALPIYSDAQSHICLFGIFRNCQSNAAFMWTPHCGAHWSKFVR